MLRKALSSRCALCKNRLSASSASSSSSSSSSSSFARRSLSTNGFSSSSPYSQSTPRENPSVSLTTLPSGLRVATLPTIGPVNGLGVYIDSGSKYEDDKTSGSSHLMDTMAFKSSKDMSSDDYQLAIQDNITNLTCVSTRETMVYQALLLPASLPKVLPLLSSTILKPLLLEEELSSMKEGAAWQIDQIKAKPELILPETLHSVAFNGQGLGRPMLIPEENLDRIGSKELTMWKDRMYRPERMVVAAVGVDHNELVDLVQEHFEANVKSTTIPPSTYPSSSSTSSSSPSPRPLSPSSNSATSKSQPTLFKSFATLLSPTSSSPVPELPPAYTPPVYTGGELFLEDSEQEFTHVQIGFEGLGILDKDIYTLATIQMLLGGGSSFSAGGPGKGMYSRLYLNVLNQYHSVDHCQAAHHCYTDMGLFAISASVVPSQAPGFIHVIARQLQLLTREGKITDEELSRAKNQLKSTLLMGLENRAVEVEDLGRQISSSSQLVPVLEMCRLIDSVNISDLHRVARKILMPRSAGELNQGLGSGEISLVVRGPTVDNLRGAREVLKSYGLGIQSK